VFKRLLIIKRECNYRSPVVESYKKQGIALDIYSTQKMLQFYIVCAKQTNCQCVLNNGGRIFVTVGASIS